MCHYTFWPWADRERISLIEFLQQQKDKSLINNVLRESSAGAKKHPDINSTVNLSEPVLADYSWRSHRIEQSKLIEFDTCQSEALLGPDLIKNILLFPREITGPVA